MRKFLFCLILLFLCNKVKGIEFTYSEWTDEYPDEVLDILIESEDRYKFYKNEIISYEYLKYNKDNKNYLFDEYILGNLYECSEKENDNEHIEVNKQSKTLYFKTSDIDSFTFSRKYDGDLYISEIDFYYNDKEIDYKTEYSFLKDGDINSYFKVENDYFIKFYEKIDGLNLKMNIYLKTTDEIKKPFTFNLLANEKYSLYGYYINYGGEVGTKTVSYDISTLVNTLRHYETTYTCRDKLYKVNYIEKKYLDGYFTNVDDYIKDENNKKTYYRYITNEYVILNADGKLVNDEKYCIKEYCLLYYINKKDEIINPKTGDDFVKNVFVLIIFFLVIGVIYLVLSNRFKKSKL